MLRNVGKEVRVILSSNYYKWTTSTVEVLDKLLVIDSEL